MGLLWSGWDNPSSPELSRGHSTQALGASGFHLDAKAEDKR